MREALGPSSVMLVAVSGYASDDVKKRAAASGFQMHLTKPPELGMLAELLERVPRRASLE